MALWGSKDISTSLGSLSIDVSAKTVTGDGSRLQTEASVGDVINIGVGATYGYAVIASITNNTTATIETADHMVNPEADVPAGTSFVVSEAPVYTMADRAYNAPELQNSVDRVVYGVDKAEMAETIDDTSPYHPAHGGWVGITTYMQTNADGSTEMRVKSEVLVAMGADNDDNGGISGDNVDDTVFPDS